MVFDKFESFLSHMYTENCIERKNWGEESFPTISDYYEKNHSFLVEKFVEQKENANDES